MAIGQNHQYSQTAGRGKYRNLYRHLCSLEALEWRATFGEIEAVIGFKLPKSARKHRPWWGNQRGENGHSHARAWSAAGWETAEVDMAAETLLFRRTNGGGVQRLTLDEILPVHPTARWPEGLSLRREDMYAYDLGDREQKRTSVSIPEGLATVLEVLLQQVRLNGAFADVHLSFAVLGLCTICVNSLSG